jgi:2-polyprenyl-3-methyl-5-hydroxy-6-metoxy-1,4-benzoquinol methylase
MLITEDYKRLNAELHSRGNYGVSGHKWAGKVHDLAGQCEAATVLDYGCGRGTLNAALYLKHRPLSYEVIEYDPAIPGKEEKPAHADIVVCGDVLEHIEPDCLLAVLDDIHSIARKAVFLVVATRPAVKTLADGRNAHLIVEPIEWWLPKLMLRWRAALLRDLGGEFLLIGAPK